MGKPQKRLRFSHDVKVQNNDDASVDNPREVESHENVSVVEEGPGCSLFFANIPKETSKTAFVDFIQSKVFETADESVQVIDFAFQPTKRNAIRVNGKAAFASYQHAGTAQRILDGMDFFGAELHVKHWRRPCLPQDETVLSKKTPQVERLLSTSPSKASLGQQKTRNDVMNGPIKVVRQACAVQVSQVPTVCPRGFHGCWNNESDIETAVRCFMQKKMAKVLDLDEDAVQIPYCYSSRTHDSYDMILEFGSKDIAHKAAELDAVNFFGHSLSLRLWRGKFEVVNDPECVIWVDGIPHMSEWPRGWSCKSVRKDVQTIIQNRLQRKFGLDNIITFNANIFTDERPMRASFEFKDRDIAQKAVALKNLVYQGLILPISPFEGFKEPCGQHNKNQEQQRNLDAADQSSGVSVVHLESRDASRGRNKTSRNSVAAASNVECYSVMAPSELPSLSLPSDESLSSKLSEHAAVPPVAAMNEPTLHVIRARLAAITGIFAAGGTSWSHDMSPSESTLANVLEQVTLLESLATAEKKKASQDSQDVQKNLTAAIAKEAKRLQEQFNEQLSNVKKAHEAEKRRMEVHFHQELEIFSDRTQTAVDEKKLLNNQLSQQIQSLNISNKTLQQQRSALEEGMRQLVNAAKEQLRPTSKTLPQEQKRLEAKFAQQLKEMQAKMEEEENIRWNESYQSLSASLEDEKEELKKELRAEYKERLVASNRSHSAVVEELKKQCKAIEEESERVLGEMEKRCQHAEAGKEALASEVISLRKTIQKYEEEGLFAKTTGSSIHTKYSDAATVALQDEIKILKEGKEKLQQQLNDTFQTLSQATTTVIENQKKIDGLQTLLDQEKTKSTELENRVEEEVTKRQAAEATMQQRPFSQSNHVPINRVPKVAVADSDSQSHGSAVTADEVLS
jgi:hypothetical protein